MISPAYLFIKTQSLLFYSEAAEITRNPSIASKDYDLLAGNFPFSSTYPLAVDKSNTMAAFLRVAFLVTVITTRLFKFRLPCEQFKVAKPLRNYSNRYLFACGI